MARRFAVATMGVWALMCAVLGAADFWEKKPFASWSDREVESLQFDISLCR